jgi:CBS domain-containing protein
MNAKDVMTHCVVTIGPEAPLRDAIARMVSHEISGMPVVDDDAGLVGMVTEGDLVRRAEMRTEAPRRRWLELLLGPGWRAEEYSRTHGRLVRDVMSTSLVTASPETPLSDVVRLMEEHSIKRIPVVDGQSVVGIVSRADLVSALAQHLAQPSPVAEPDESIRRSVVAQMKRQPWCPAHSIRVTVHGGVVRFDGAVFDERERHALHVLAGNVQGVRSVDDRMLCIEPMSGAILSESDAQPVGTRGRHAVAAGCRTSIR